MLPVEQYPQLKANEGFMNLQAQLEGTENRINVARNKFNEAARIYNEKVRQFPTKLAAMIFGLKLNLTLNQLQALKTHRL